MKVREQNCTPEEYKRKTWLGFGTKKRTKREKTHKDGLTKIYMQSLHNFFSKFTYIYKFNRQKCKSIWRLQLQIYNWRFVVSLNLGENWTDKNSNTKKAKSSKRSKEKNGMDVRSFFFAFFVFFKNKYLPANFVKSVPPPLFETAAGPNHCFKQRLQALSPSPSAVVMWPRERHPTPVWDSDRSVGSTAISNGGGGLTRWRPGVLPATVWSNGGFLI